MIQEDYVSFEVAKLLKEKGFDIPVWTRYEDTCNEVLYGNEYDWNKSPFGQVSAPTCQMATAYVRKTYNIFIRIGYNRYYKEYSYDIFFMDIDNELDISGYNFKTYKDAVDAALKEVLENII